MRRKVDDIQPVVEPDIDTSDAGQIELMAPTTVESRKKEKEMSMMASLPPYPGEAM